MAQLADINESITEFFTFIASKLKDFKHLSMGEQISFCCIGLGLILILTALILFIIKPILF